MLTQTAAIADVSPYQVVQASPSAGDMDKLAACSSRRSSRL